MLPTRNTWCSGCMHTHHTTLTPGSMLQTPSCIHTHKRIQLARMHTLGEQYLGVDCHWVPSHWQPREWECCHWTPQLPAAVVAHGTAEQVECPCAGQHNIEVPTRQRWQLLLLTRSHGRCDAGAWGF
jgi:hypothetical protein